MNGQKRCGTYTQCNNHHIVQCNSNAYTMNYSTSKNKIMPSAATWMQPEIIILSEVSQKEKDKHYMIITYI